MNTDELIEALEERGYEWREYSGRMMFGEKCVGIELENSGDLFELGQELPGLACGNPTTDSMGRKIIAYWPRFKVSADEIAAS